MSILNAPLDTDEFAHVCTSLSISLVEYPNIYCYLFFLAKFFSQNFPHLNTPLFFIGKVF